MGDNGKIEKRGAKRGIFLALKIVLFILAGALFAFSFLKITFKDFRPSFFGARFLAVVTDSMEPKLPAGALAAVKDKPAAEKLKENTIISYVLPGGNGEVFTHRIVRLELVNGETMYRTKGDNAVDTDSYYVEYSDIIGVYAGWYIPGVGYAAAFLSSFQGLMCTALVLVVLIVAAMSVNSVRAEDDEQTLFKKVIDRAATEIAGESCDSARTAEALCELNKKPKKKRDREKRLEILTAFAEGYTLAEAEIVTEDASSEVLADTPPDQFPSSGSGKAGAHKDGTLLAKEEKESAEARSLSESESADDNQDAELAAAQDRTYGQRLPAENIDFEDSGQRNGLSVRLSGLPASGIMNFVMRSEADLKASRQLAELLKRNLAPLSEAEAEELKALKAVKQISPRPVVKKEVSLKEREDLRQKRRRAMEKRREEKLLKERSEKELLEAMTEAEREVYLIDKQARSAQAEAVKQLKRIERQRRELERLKRL